MRFDNFILTHNIRTNNNTCSLLRPRTIHCCEFCLSRRIDNRFMTILFIYGVDQIPNASGFNRELITDFDFAIVAVALFAIRAMCGAFLGVELLAINFVYWRFRFERFHRFCPVRNAFLRGRYEF